MDSCLRRNDSYTLGFIPQFIVLFLWIPAYAGMTVILLGFIHQFIILFLWIPAYAGMTVILLASSLNLSPYFYGFLPTQE
jgi:hypothetical protein